MIFSQGPLMPMAFWAKRAQELLSRAIAEQVERKSAVHRCSRQNGFC
jgi:hypothetical protein